jgi:hypothetical protein
MCTEVMVQPAGVLAAAEAAGRQIGHVDLTQRAVELYAVMHVCLLVTSALHTRSRAAARARPCKCIMCWFWRRGGWGLTALSCRCAHFGMLRLTGSGDRSFAHLSAMQAAKGAPPNSGRDKSDNTFMRITSPTQRNRSVEWYELKALLCASSVICIVT